MSSVTQKDKDAHRTMHLALSERQSRKRCKCLEKNPRTRNHFSERAKGAEKASCGETVVQKDIFGQSVSSLPLLRSLGAPPVSWFLTEGPCHLGPVTIKPVGRIFKISDANPIRRKCGKCGGPLSPYKNKGLRRLHCLWRAKKRKTRKMRTRKREKCGKCG